MINECIFLFHVIVLIGMTLLALKIGEKALFAFAILMTLVANLFLLKQIELFSLTVTASDAYTIAALFSMNLLQEYYGKKTASNLIKVNFFCLAIFGALSVVHLAYVPSTLDLTQRAYQEILSLSPRLVVASLTSFLITQKIDITFFTFLRERFFKTSLGKAALFSSLLSQTVDTILFSFLALSGVVSSIGSVIIVSLIIKWLTILLMSPMMALSKKIRVTA